MKYDPKLDKKKKKYQRYFQEKEIFEVSTRLQEYDFEPYFPEQPLAPYWEDNWYGGDNEYYFDLHAKAGWIGLEGYDYKVEHVKQDRVWTKEEVYYNMDKHGFRSHHSARDLRNTTRILHAGQCHTFGMGIPYEGCYTSLTHGSHINLSPYKTVMDLWEPLGYWIEEFKPTHLIITNPRFFLESDYMYEHLYQQNAHRNDIEEWKSAVSQMYLEQGKMYFNQFLDYVNSFKIPAFVGWEVSRMWRHLWIRKNLKPRKYITYVPHTPTYWVVDLARDNRRPGFGSHINVAARMNEWIENYPQYLGQYWTGEDFDYPHKALGPVTHYERLGTSN